MNKYFPLFLSHRQIAKNPYARRKKVNIFAYQFNLITLI